MKTISEGFMEIIKNGKVFTKDFIFKKADIILEKGEIKDIIYYDNNGDNINNISDNNSNIYENNKINDNKSDSNECIKVIDATGLMVIPGLVDIHFHGCVGSDFCDATYEAIEKMAEYEKEHGIAAICPATMTLPKQRLLEICKNAKEYKNIQANNEHLKDVNTQGNYTQKLKAKFVGINLEGPFISPDRVGAQNPEYVQKPDVEMLQELIEESDNMVKLVTIAPEREGAIECISKLHDKIRFSVGHTMASYDEASLAYKSGARHATHLYNAMTGLNHRSPGVVGAARDGENVTAELICDGIHVHPAVIRATFSMFGSDRVILISDSMRACGMPDGESELGGQVVIKKGSEARLVTGELAGSVTNVYDCMVKAIEFGIPVADAIKAATYNPAKAIEILDEFGTIEIGKKPGFVLVNEDFSINQVL